MKKLLDRIRRGAASLVQRLKDWLGVEEPQVSPGEAAPQPGRFLAASIASDGWNRRSYRLYVPNGIGTTPVPLIVMLHGCRQTAESFAQGTRMNDIADARRFLVLYPSQSRLSNPLGCWNWFLPRNQGRTGEPAEIMRLVDEIASGWPVDPKRVFVAGLSAGGAMAETLGRNYPERLAAIAVHSALPGDAALSVKDALAAMESGARHASPSPQVPVMLFHGARDATVTIDNAEAMLAAARAAHPDAEEAVFPAGESTRLTLVTRERPVMEYWRIPALAHAWSGGDPEGGYTDPEGPDASAEIVRFFLDTVAGSARALRAGNRVPA